jgi:hypothetical protein
VTSLLRVTLVAAICVLAAVGVQEAAGAAPSPTSSPGGESQLSHTVTVFGLIFFGIAALAVVLFIIVVLRLRKS